MFIRLPCRYRTILPSSNHGGRDERPNVSAFSVVDSADFL